MKRFITRYAKAVWLVCLTFIAAVAVYAQGEVPPAAEFPIILFVPYFLGVFVHWLKKYTVEGVQVNFLNWIIQNIGWTVGSLVAGITAVWAIFSSTPGAFVPLTIGSFIIVFTTAMAADTINSGGSPKPNP